MGNINQRWCFNQIVFVVEIFGRFEVNSVSLVFIILASFILQGFSHHIKMCLLAQLRLEYQMSFTILQFHTVLCAHTSSSFHILILIKRFLKFWHVIQFCPDNIENYSSLGNVTYSFSQELHCAGVIRK